MSNKLPTAEEFLDLQHQTIPSTKFDIRQVLIEFTRMHVKAALEKASKEAKTNIHYSNYGSILTEWNAPKVDKDSILNAYPLTKIK